MKIRPEELGENGYLKLEELVHSELVPFVQLYIKKRTKYSVIYYISNIIVFCLVGYLFVFDYSSPNYSLGERVTYFSYGLAIAFALLPIHEYIHVLAYKYQGATNTSYDANLRKFYFMALADKFVANKREFEVIALAPFLIITTILTIILFNVSMGWTLTIASVLLAHTAMCSGDFGLLSYFDYNKDKQIVTYDDVEKGITYFYGHTEVIKTPK